ncbi:hypothetical protein [Arhodomonas aquaeolei]|uniref:hypothetical protein n=1 Tax=Arhodomonas aquaeolei TaxID=2369 RepID=UPI00036A0EBC|nr:hypothetical protein [Arhodomonas aquaeolei]
MDTDNRPLSALERYHARSIHLRLILFKWLALFFGVVLTLLGLMLPVAFAFDRQSVPLPLLLLLVLLDLVIIALGLFITAHGLWRDTKLRETATQLHGKLTEKKHTVVNPNTGSRTTHRLYFIDDIQISWPSGSETVYLPLVGRDIELTVAMIDVKSRNRLKALRQRVGIDKLAGPGKHPSGIAVVLNYRQAVNIHGVLDKYGRNYLLGYQLRWAIGAGLFVALTFFLLMQPYTLTFLSQTNFLLMLLVLIGYAIGGALAMGLVIEGYQKLRKRLDPDYDDTPHEERLKG